MRCSHPLLDHEGEQDESYIQRALSPNFDQMLQFAAFFRQLVEPLVQPLSMLQLPECHQVELHKFHRIEQLDELFCVFTGQRQILHIQEEENFISTLLALKPFVNTLVESALEYICELHLTSINGLFSTLMGSQHFQRFRDFGWDPLPDSSLFACSIAVNGMDEFLLRSGVGGVLDAVGKLYSYVSVHGPLKSRLPASELLAQSQALAQSELEINDYYISEVFGVFNFKAQKQNVTAEQRGRYYLTRMQTAFTSDETVNALLRQLTQDWNFSANQALRDCADRLVEYCKTHRFEKVKRDHQLVVRELEQLRELLYDAGEQGLDIERSYVSFPVVYIDGKCIDWELCTEYCEIRIEHEKYLARQRESAKWKINGASRNQSKIDLIDMFQLSESFQCDNLSGDSQKQQASGMFKLNNTFVSIKPNKSSLLQIQEVVTSSSQSDSWEDSWE